MSQGSTQFYPICIWGTQRYEEKTNSNPEKNVKHCVKYNSCSWNVQLLTQSDLFKAKHHLLHIQLMVAMAKKSSRCTVLLQYAWQLQVYHSEISIMILADLSHIRQLIL